MATITVDPNTSHQTHKRWELSVDIEWLYRTDVQVSLSNIIQQLADWGVNSLDTGWGGLLENPTDYYLDWFNNGHTFGAGPTDYTAALRAFIYEVKHTTTLAMTGPDDQVNQLITPFKAAVVARGDAPNWTFRYVAYTGDDTADGDGTYDHATAATYADFIGLLWTHFQNTFGFVPDVLIPINEPNHGNTDASWQVGTGTAVGDRIKAAGDRLVTLGFASQIFDTPSTENVALGLTWTPNVIAVSGVPAFIAGYDSHLYGTTWADAGDVTDIEDFAALAAGDGVYLGTSETWPGSGGDVSRTALHKALTIGNFSFWNPTTVPGLVYFDSGGNVSIVDTTNSPSSNTREFARFWVQYFKYIRPQAVRKGASSSDSTNFMPVAYMGTNGKYVVVVTTTGSGSVTVAGLPDATYGISYTTASAFQTELTPQVVSGGNSITETIPAGGTITFYNTEYLDPPPADAPRGNHLRFRN